MAHPTATPGPRSLTKREFPSGLQCHKQLWWRVHDPQAGELIPDQNARAVRRVDPDRCHLEVAEGRAASRELMELLLGESMDPQERSFVRESLLAYCKLDTWAMVRLLQRLRELAIDGG